MSFTLSYYPLGRNNQYSVYEHIEPDQVGAFQSRMDRELFPIELSESQACHIAALLTKANTTGLLELGACRIKCIGNTSWAVYVHGRCVSVESFCTRAFVLLQRSYALALPVEMRVPVWEEWQSRRSSSLKSARS